MQKSRNIKWNRFGIAALLLLPITFAGHIARADKAPAPNAPIVTSEPVQISGTVRQYFTDRSGFVTALSLETPSGMQQVHFAPSWAKRLLDKNAVGSPLDGWAIIHQENGWSWGDLVSIGKDRPHRFLTDEFHSGAQRLDSQPWIWKDSKNETVEGDLSEIVVDDKGNVLALVLDNGALVRVPLTVRNEDLGAAGTDAIAPLFKGVHVQAWGDREWMARGEVSIYSEHLATDGLSINGKTVSAIGIPRFPVNNQTLLNWNINLIGATPAVVVGQNGEYTPFGSNVVMASTPVLSNSAPSAPTLVMGQHTGHAMLMTVDGKFYPALHEGIEVFAIVHNDAVELPLVNGSYLSPSSLTGSKLVMVMDDGRQLDMSSSDSQLFVNLPDGNTAPVHL